MAMFEELDNNGAVQGGLTVFPGFRFYPTEEELVGFYLKKRIEDAHHLNFDMIIPTLDLYRYDPWELPGLANDAGERQWFFFVPRDNRKFPRPSRLTVSGYWKATGSDRAVRNELLQYLGFKKILVFYKGKAPFGQRTDWIMNEYRIPELSSSPPKKNMDMVLCRIYRKTASQKSIEQRTKADRLDKEERIVLDSDEFEEKCHRATIDPNQMKETKDSSLHHKKNPKGVCSSATSTTDNDVTLFDYLEPIISYEENMVLKNPKDRGQLQFELPNLSMDCLFSEQIETSYSILPAPSPVEIPFH